MQQFGLELQPKGAPSLLSRIHNDKLKAVPNKDRNQVVTGVVAVSLRSSIDQAKTSYSSSSE